MTAYQKLKLIFKELSELNYVYRIMMWDEAVMMPEGAGTRRANALATLNGAYQKRLINKKNKRLLAAAKQESLTSAWDQTNIALMEKKYQRAACIPAKLMEKLINQTMLCQQTWRHLRPQNDWKAFLPHLNKTFKLVKEVTKRRSQALGLNLYDTVLDEYVPGFNQVSIDQIFAKITTALPDITRQIRDRQSHEKIIPLTPPFAIEQQKQLGKEVMAAFAFDFNHGRLDTSHHPFCDGDPVDVRITTRYNDHEFLSSLLGVCHETGHGLYEQGLPRDWIDQPVGRVDNMAMHESQSLLIEMQVCCSLPFYQYLTPSIQNSFGQHAALNADNLYKMITYVEPSLIRVDADEVTYPLHIILRYELEKRLFNEEITVKDLPHCWHELMMKYLGVATKDNHKDGVMQDVHWPAGAFGYFPAYTLGRIIAAQFFAHFKQSRPQFADDFQQGNFQPLKQWLNTQIHAQGSLLDTQQLLLKVTGSELNSNYFIDYIKEKYL